MKNIYTILFCLSTFMLFGQYATTWKNTGPNLFPENESFQINGIARCTQIKFDPNNPNHLFVTSASGGVWKSTNNGDSWSNLGTDNLPAMKCASICIDHSNSDVLYLGSGDPNYYYNGYGVWKSTNGGLTWNLSNTGINTGLIIEIIMHPTNNQILIAATNDGIYKTNDAGNTWNLVKSGGDFRSMVLKPNSIDTLYAVTSSQIWRSIDFGSTWLELTNGVTIPKNDGEGMRLAVSASNVNIVYVGMIADGGKLLKSIDGGDNFVTVYNNPSQNLVGYKPTENGQGDYNYFLTSDPTNANILYSVAHCVWKSLDGGISWTKLTDWWEKCHTDMHGIRIHPSFPDKIYNVNDGGVFLSTDGGLNWVNKSDGIAATEIYHASQSKLTRDMMSIGTQDNGELYQSGSNWLTNRGGDWTSKSSFSYNSNMVYYNENGNRRTLVGAESSFNLPFTSINDVVFEFNRKLPNKAFAGLNNVFYCNNLNASTPTWSQLGSLSSNSDFTIYSIHSSIADSSVLYVMADNSLYRCDNIFAANPVFAHYNTPYLIGLESSIATIKSNSNVIYITCGSRVFRSSNKGQSFVNINAGLPFGVNILKIYHDEYSNDESIYLCTAKGVYYKNIHLNAWQNISFNLPTISDIYEFMFYNDGSAASVLKVAYFGRGVWELPLNTSMPPAVEFNSDKQFACVLQPIYFSDKSFSNNNITSWSWSFPGATPSTSNSQNPNVYYNLPGNYEVTLTVTDSNGSNFITKTGYIQINESNNLSFHEGFETFLPNGWTVYNEGKYESGWLQNTDVGGFGTSSECIRYNNYNYPYSSLYKDEIRTVNFNLLNTVNPKLYFDIAYAESLGTDSLAVLISFDCGENFQRIYIKGGIDLATTLLQEELFKPISSEWRTDTIQLNAFTNHDQVMFAFQNIGQFGNAIYLDNINLEDDNTNSILSLPSKKIECRVFPNPSNNIVNIQLINNNLKDFTIELYDLLGKNILNKKMISSDNSKTSILDVSKLNEGVYFMRIYSQNYELTEKLIIER